MYVCLCVYICLKIYVWFKYISLSVSLSLSLPHSVFFARFAYKLMSSSENSCHFVLRFVFFIVPNMASDRLVSVDTHPGCISFLRDFYFFAIYARHANDGHRFRPATFEIHSLYPKVHPYYTDRRSLMFGLDR